MNPNNESTQNTEATRVDTEGAPTPTPTSSTPTTDSGKRNMILGVIVTLLALGIGYVTLFTDIKLTSYIPFMDATVATVNGVAISETEFENSSASVRATIEAQGGDTETEGAKAAIKSQAISQLINAQLLIQAATEAGYTADPAEVDAQIAAIEENFGGKEAFAARLEELNITEKMFRQDVVEQVMVTAYIEGETDIADTAVSDEEIAAFYANIQAQYGEDIPSVEDLREQIVADLQIQKQQAELGDIIATLRDAADIEINI